MAKTHLGINVLDAARQRISRVFDDFPRICVSFSAGKDSGVMLHLVGDEARKRNRRFSILLVDLEGQYKLTIDYALQMRAEYADIADFYWVCLPISLRNAVSQFEPQWMCWEPGREQDWIRQPPEDAITDPKYFPFFHQGMEFEEFTPEFGRWFAQDNLCACLIGIRTQESLNRWRSIARKNKARFQGLQWTTRIVDAVYNIYPIYDWTTEDIWRYNGKYNKPYNRLYDRMHQAGLTLHQARICQPYGDDQRKGLWLFHTIEPETWARVVARVNGANQGALYAQQSGNITGNIKVTKPDDITWQQFAHRLLNSMPETTAEHYRNKIAVFIYWYQSRGYPNGIPDEGPANEKGAPSWTRVCKALLRNDYWCKGLSFSQHKSGAYTAYKRLMKKRRDTWNII